MQDRFEDERRTLLTPHPKNHHDLKIKSNQRWKKYMCYKGTGLDKTSGEIQTNSVVIFC